MADIVATVGMAVSKGEFRTEKPVVAQQIAMTGTEVVDIPFTATTSAAALTLPAGVTPGVCYLVNRETSGSAYIEVGGSNGGGFVGTVAALAKERWSFRTKLGATAIYVRASAGTLKGSILICGE